MLAAALGTGKAGARPRRRVQELNPREHYHLVESWERKRKPIKEPEKVSSEKMAMTEGSSETSRAQFQE